MSKKVRYEKYYADESFYESLDRLKDEAFDPNETLLVNETHIAALGIRNARSIDVVVSLDRFLEIAVDGFASGNVAIPDGTLGRELGLRSVDNDMPIRVGATSDEPEAFFKEMERKSSIVAGWRVGHDFDLAHELILRSSLRHASTFEPHLSMNMLRNFIVARRDKAELGKQFGGVLRHYKF